MDHDSFSGEIQRDVDHQSRHSFRSLRSTRFHQSESTNGSHPENSVSNVGSGSFDRSAGPSPAIEHIFVQTLIFDHVELFGEPDEIHHDPPNILIELFDKDQYVTSAMTSDANLFSSLNSFQGAPDFLGRVQCAPIVRLVPDETKPTVKLRWFPVKRGKDDAGELLAAFELFLVCLFCRLSTVNLHSTRRCFSYLRRTRRRRCLPSRPNVVRFSLFLNPFDLNLSELESRFVVSFSSFSLSDDDVFRFSRGAFET